MQRIISWIGLIGLLGLLSYLLREMVQEQKDYESIEQDYVDATHWQTKLGNAWQLQDESRDFTTKFVTHFDASQTAIEGFTNRGATFLETFLDDFIGEKQYKEYLTANEPRNLVEDVLQTIKEEAVGAVVDKYDYRSAIHEARGPFADSLWKNQNDFDIPILVFSYEAIDTLFGQPDPLSQEILRLGRKYDVLYKVGPLPTLTNLESTINNDCQASNTNVHRLGGWTLLVLLFLGGLTSRQVRRGDHYALLPIILISVGFLWVGLTQTLSSSILQLGQGSLEILAIEYDYEVTQQSLSYDQMVLVDLVMSKLDRAAEEPLLLMLLLVTSMGLIIVPVYQLGKMMVLALTGTTRHTWLDHLLSLKWIDMMVFYTIVYGGFQLYNSTTPRVGETTVGLRQMVLHIGASIETITTIQLGFLSFILFGVGSWTLRACEILLINNKKIKLGTG